MSVFGWPWVLGLLLVFAFTLFGELVVTYDVQLFERVGVNRNAILLALWVLPGLASYIASYYSAKNKLISGLSFVIVFPFIGALGHYINGELGGVVDVVGFRGAVATFKFYLVTGGVLVVIGVTLGFLSSKIKSRSR